MTISIDQDKLARVKCEVLGMLDKTSCKKKDLEEVAGLLAHCATVVKRGPLLLHVVYIMP